MHANANQPYHRGHGGAQRKTAERIAALLTNRLQKASSTRNPKAVPMVHLRSANVLFLGTLLIWIGTAVPITAGHGERTPSQSDSITIPETCPVTKPPDKPFVPPSPYPRDNSKNDFWFGTNQLWTILPADGTWNHLGHYTPDDPTFLMKMFWWHEGYDYRKEPN